MDDSIPVEYDRLKELFAQKVVQQQESKAEEPTMKLRPSSSEVMKKNSVFLFLVSEILEKILFLSNDTVF